MKVDLHTLSRSATEPLHYQLSQLLRHAIQAGIFQPGERIAPERQFIEEGGLSYPTVARAFKDLAADGLVTRRSGAGTFVSETLPQPQEPVLKRIGVTYYRRHTPYFDAIMRGIEDECRQQGIEVRAIATGLNAESETRTIQQLEEHDVEALICIPLGTSGLQAELKRLLDSEMPVSTIAFHVPTLGCDAIVFDNEQGAFLAAEHLLDMGHERIAYVGTELKYPHTLNLEIMDGIRLAHRQRDLRWNPERAHLLPVSFHENDPVHQQHLLDMLNVGSSEGATACICSADGTARYVGFTLGEAGLDVPADLSLIGFGDLSLASRLDPPLTTVRWPLERAGRQAVRSLLGQLHAPHPHAIKTVLDTSLVIRRSTTQPPVETPHA